jgi:hypothetical protein
MHTKDAAFVYSYKFKNIITPILEQGKPFSSVFLYYVKYDDTKQSTIKTFSAI